MSSALKQVEYSTFQKTLARFGCKRIKQKSQKTYLYDLNNNILAVLQMAAINSHGESIPPQYFIKNNEPPPQ